MRFQGRDLLELSEAEMQQVRGRDISMVFQEPIASLNPVVTVGRQIAEVFIRHEGVPRRDAWERAVDVLRLVHMPEPERRAHEYPHQLSGGMNQRVMIAMAVACGPKVLLADEPTTALDVTIQAQILDLMAELKEKLGTAIVLITHDMGIIAENARRVVVMYAGRKVEEAAVEELFSTPCHPYTSGLLGSIPRLDSAAGDTRERLREVAGIVPSPLDVSPGCAFAPRCPLADDECRHARPELEEKRPGHYAACWHTDRLLGREGERTARYGRGPRCWRSRGCASTSPSAPVSSPARSGRCTRWTACRSRSRAARPSGSSARAAAESPPPARRCSS